MTWKFLTKAYALSTRKKLVPGYELGGLVGGCSTGLTLAREMPAFTCPPNTAGWLTSDGSLVVFERFHQVRVSRMQIMWCPFGSVRHARDRRYCSGKSDRMLQHAQAYYCTYC